MHYVTTEVLLCIYLAMGIIIGIAFLVCALYAVFAVRGFIRRMEARVNPVLKQVEDAVSKVTASAKDVADQAEHVAHTVSEQAESIAQTARVTADHIAVRIESTADLVRDTVVTPVVGVNSLLAGVRKASELLRDRWTKRSEG